MSLSAGRAERAPPTVSRRPAIGPSPGRLEQRVYVVRARPMRVPAGRCRDCRVRAECSHGGIAVAAPQRRSPPLVRRAIPGRRRPRIPELFLTFDIGLPTGALGVEDDWMNIDLACAARNECNATPTPVRLHPVTMPAERLQQVIERHLGDIDGEIEVAVDPGLMPNQCVDTPPAGNPDAVKPCPVSDTQHSADIGADTFQRASSPTSVTMRLAKQVRGCPAPVGLRLRGRAAARPFTGRSQEED